MDPLQHMLPGDTAGQHGALSLSRLTVREIHGDLSQETTTMVTSSEVFPPSVPVPIGAGCRPGR